MRKHILFLAAFLVTFAANAQKPNLWTSVSESSIKYNLFEGRKKPSSYQLFQLNELVMRSSLTTAPSERVVSASASSFLVTVPTENGRFDQFRVVDAPVMDPSLSAKYPGIKSYAGISVTNPERTIRFSVSPEGFYAMIFATGKSTIYIDPVSAPGQTAKYYVSVARKDVQDYRQPFSCLTEPVSSKISIPSGITGRLAADDGRLRTYRLALMASGEFSQYWLNGSETTDAERKAKVLAAMNTQLTRVNGIFERDFGVRLTLISNNDAIIYLDAATDPIGTTSSSWNSQTQTTITNVIGSANYDIGHLVHRGPTNNGNAGCIGCVCTAGSKGSGWTSYIDLASDYFVVDYLAHEIGHQFGGNHTFAHSFEGTIAQCEPGSGSTIMSYAGITGATTDVQAHNDDYFHSISIQQISTYIKSTAGGCAVVTVTGNTAPTVNAGLDYTIPRSTPFSLTGTASDVDGDALTYYWEQINARTSSSPTIPSATATAGPNFRSFIPTTSTQRTFPQLSSILDGTNTNKWEVLPSVARTLTFRFTAKENRVGGSNANTDDAIVTVNGTAGPFAVTAPNTSSVSWLTGSTQTVTWSVNSTNVAPVNCANVRITLSTDGGLTFPIELLASTPNDGTQTVTVPSVLSTTCRVRVEAVGNIFFDISNANFTITDVAPPCGTPGGLTSSAVTASSATISWSAVSGATNYDVDYKTNASGTWITAATATTNLSVNLSGLAASTLYDWRVRANCAGGSSTYAQAQFTTTAVSTCPGIYDVSTNGTLGGAALIPLNTDVRGLISPRGDNDYYRFVITTGGTATVTVSTLPADYDLRIYNSSGTQLAISQNGGTTNETNTRTYTAGTYYARVYGYQNANNATSCYTLRVQTGTASREGRGDDLIQTLKVQMFPNPTSQILNINIVGYDGSKVVNIFDVNGKLVMSKNLLSGSNALDVSKLSGGIYFAKVKAADGTDLYTEKFIKQ